MLNRPRFQPHLHVEVVPGEGIVLLSETGHTILAGEIYAILAPYLDGRRSPEAIVAALTAEADSDEIRKTLDVLERQGHLTEAAEDMPAGTAALWATHGLDPGLASARLSANPVSLTAVGNLTLDPFVAALASLGVHVSPDGERQVVLTDDYLRPGLEAFNRHALASGRTWLLAKPVGCMIWVGPVFRPGQSGCWECLAQRLRGNREVEHFLLERAGRLDPFSLARAFTSATQQVACNLAASVVAAWIARDEAPELEETVLTLDVRSWKSETHTLIRRPQCPACGDLPQGADEGETIVHPVVLHSRRKIFTGDGGHRVRTPEATTERYQRHVSPITGVVSRLARHGVSADSVVHAYGAGLNLARPPRSLAMLRKVGKALRTTTGGKGVTDAQARASALCEALERHSGVFTGEEPRRRARFRELGDAAIHPNACMGFSERQYRERDAWNARGAHTQVVPLPFDEDARLAWTPVWSLTRGEARFLPTAFCFYEYPVLPEAEYCVACSNGNAAGNTLEEAILQGFLELVERDSVALWWYSRVRRPAVALESFDEPYLGRAAAYLAGRGRDLTVLDLTADLEIPVFAAVSRRRDERPEQIMFGFGAHLDPRIAVLRAVTELNQLLMHLWWGSERAAHDEDDDPSVRQWLATATLAQHPYLAPDPAQPMRAASHHPRCWSDDLREDVRFCQALIERHGMDLLVLDQTRPDIGLPVVKVIVPGLRHFWPRLAPGRLYDVPVRLGWIPAPLTEEQLNPIGIFI